MPTVTSVPKDARFDTKVAAAEADWERDTMGGFQNAQAAYREALDYTAGRSPQELGMVHLGLARSAICEAEYYKLEGQSSDQALTAASAALGEAEKSLGAENAQLLLVRSDLLRVNGDASGAGKMLDAAEEAGAMAKDVALIRAAIDLHSASPNLPALAMRLKALSKPEQKRPRAQFLMAWALDKAGRQAEARDVTRALVTRNPDHGPGNRLLARLSVEIAPPKPAETKKDEKVPGKTDAKPRAKEPVAPVDPATSGFDTLMSRGFSLMQAGKCDQAIALFEAAATKKPTSPEPLANLGWCALDGNRAAKGVSYFKQALGKNPRYADAMFGLAEALDRSGNRTDAIKAYNAYLQTHPNGQHAAMVRRKLSQIQ